MKDGILFMEMFQLNNDIKIPVIGYGTYMTDPSETKSAVTQALSVGYRLIDTAQNYGNEHEVGQAINESNIPRDEIFVTSKTQTSGYSSTKRGIDSSLLRANLDYFDLMIIHWPNFLNYETYHALEDAYQEGKLRSIGLSNFNHQQIDHLMKKATVKPAVDQIETHLTWQQGGMHDYLSKNNILHEAWAPLGEGSGNVLLNPTLKSIGEKYGKSTAQVMLRFYIQNHILAIPKSMNQKHLQDNLNVFDFQLTDKDIQIIKSEDRKQSESHWPSSMLIEENY